MRIRLLSFLIGFGLAASGQVQDTTKHVKYAAIPILNYSTTMGFTVGVMGQAYYAFDSDDTTSPKSSTGVFGMYTTNQTYFFAAFQRLYLSEDRWRVMMGAGHGDINFQFWQELPVIGGSFIGFDTKADFVLARVERKVYDELYFGVRAMYCNALTSYDVPDNLPDDLRFDRRNLNNIGYLFNFDKRDHQINPYKGYNIELLDVFYGDAIGSDNDFQKVQLTYNHYYPIVDETQILATRVRVESSIGDVPFQGQSVIGQDDIRGYSSGKYRDNQVYAIQAEYRWRFYNNFGMVGFAGIASAVENFAQLADGEILPGAGLGLRYMLIPEQRVNIGLDIAAGKGDWGIYFRIGEAFGR
ncbi:BamA/TamA family outer membrane protein [Phaeocystidibacter marisrubri]|uniref:BamA/TamA family outer membrane protein n=1 Tax=Phaeocystidibacter marisrubri TaxID=1577780 RepID=A0A6L3ZH42_9FLAO|nr:BamA/TamA family outer membrane protein [Phaeocystidibacter marisrubri]KAB2816949.1 BamA/TamA family outer membrane protein [Phaeocystidibacter marisrubri]GGH77473.1 membrane protein [Phaeocystidibacter marisrubri]